MILILSHSFEPSTDIVIDWLYYYDNPFIRLNTLESFFKAHLNINISNTRNQFLVNGISDEKLNCIWIRRWRLKETDIQFIMADNDKDVHTELGIKQLICSEFRAISEFLFLRWQDKNWLTSPSQYDVNKIYVLSAAAKIGLRIPATFINNKVENTASRITKTIGNISLIRFNTLFYIPYTAVVDDKKCALESHSLSLTQNLIEKQYEIRSFYFFEKFYSMAIFSQQDTQTQIDFRKYNKAKPNRVIPFKLPQDIENQLNLLMKHLNLDQGSIDMIVSKSGEFIFLEVNPVGQFGMISEPCNYYLEELFAQRLINLNQSLKNG
jgi:ATP-GRASP peptide maturase of grasp-with-spasm system